MKTDTDRQTDRQTNGIHNDELSISILMLIIIILL